MIHMKHIPKSFLIRNNLHWLKKNIFASCWNDKEKDEIALWYLYTSLCGARIKMRSDMFGSFYNFEEFEDGFCPKIDVNIKISGINNNIKYIYGPSKIKYVDNKEEIYKDVVGKSIANKNSKNEFTMVDIDLKKLGRRKISDWSYENEWRFLIYPFIQIHANEELFRKMDERKAPESIYNKYIDVKYITEIEEIMFAPQTTQKDKELVREKIEILGKDIPLVDSQIKTIVHIN